MPSVLKRILPGFFALACLMTTGVALADDVNLLKTGKAPYGASRSGRVTRAPDAGEASPINSPDIDSPDGVDTSSDGGLTLLERMGVPMPPLPPEKPYHGPIDLAYGAFQRGLFATAYKEAEVRAQKGDAAAETLLGELLSRGLGVRRDPKAAALWYGKAAKAGNPAAMFIYSLLLYEGQDVTPDRALAEDYMKRAALAGNASAEFNWAQILVSQNPGGRGLDLALPFYLKSADQGIADAQYAVALIYRNQADLGPEKAAEARQWLFRAARAGFDTAQLDLGIWLINGICGPQDLEDGFKWLWIAANRGNVAAQNRLAHAYVEALGTRPDPVAAAKWYVLSRRAGLNDPSLEDFYLGLPDRQQKQAIEAANAFRIGPHQTALAVLQPPGMAAPVPMRTAPGPELKPAQPASASMIPQAEGLPGVPAQMSAGHEDSVPAQLSTGQGSGNGGAGQGAGQDGKAPLLQEKSGKTDSP